jgi:GNAT superfamily N-acetyltransferase
VSTTGASIRRLLRADAARYRDLMLPAYELEADAFLHAAAERASLPLDWWRDRIGPADGSSVVFGAFADGDLVGTAGVRFGTAPGTRHEAAVFGMYVAPGGRGGGVGRALLAAAIGYAGSRAHIRLVQLALIDGNAPALALYRSCGFRAFASEPCAGRAGAAGRTITWMSLDIALLDATPPTS